MNNKTVITALLLLVSSDAFVVRERLRPLDTHRRPSTRLLDTEKPDFLVGQTFNISEAKQTLQVPVPLDEPPVSKQEFVDFPVPYKIQTKDKGLWYDEKLGPFMKLVLPNAFHWPPFLSAPWIRPKMPCYTCVGFRTSEVGSKKKTTHKPRRFRPWWCWEADGQVML